MSGNVMEFCWDKYKYNSFESSDSDYYSRSPKINPKGDQDGKGIVMRGGNYDDISSECRVANWESDSSASTFRYLGFRVVRSKL